MAINKINVTRGVQWVEFPELDLRILCGCPADAVKHLIKRGLILSHEVQGVRCETGPNAILVSDLPIQNGEFANLAEFPVLQMLYKQGMIIPGHPNNTGRKPLLIGAADQVQSQLGYIYRGNYGLVSREEMMVAGLSQAQAEELYRIKLKFAFGRIQPTTELLNTHIVGEESIQLAPGLSLKRLRPNVFEFTYITYRTESITVDLNLPADQSYECAYPLGHRRFEPEYFSVIHSGEGDGWDANRPCMSSILTYQGSIYLIDAGPHLINTITALGIGIEQIDGIFHTHAHDDHFAGLTALMRSGRRTRYFATPLVRASVTKKLMALLGLEEHHFSDYFDICDLQFDQWNNIDGLEVMPVYSPHPVETNIYLFRTLWGDGYKTYAHYADIASFKVLRAMITDDATKPGMTQACFDKIYQAYMTLVDVKKIDIGGGMIHGEAIDFASDTSKRILLAHRAGELTLEEKGIGSCATFGTVDVLIEGVSDGLRRHAFNALQGHLPGAAFHDLRMLVNHPLSEINPGSIFLKEGDIRHEVLLIVSGRAEKICSRNNFCVNVPTGALIGDSIVLGNHPSYHTYRACSFLRVMRIPAALYCEVIQRNGLLERVRRVADLRTFLSATTLFSEGLAATTLGKIIDFAREHTIAAGEEIPLHKMLLLNIVRTGKIERMIGDRPFDTLEPGDFFGEEGVVFKIPTLFRLRATEPTTLIQIPGSVIDKIPILRWKIFEHYQQQTARILHGNVYQETFTWDENLSVGIAHVDIQHKQLIRIGNTIDHQLSTTHSAQESLLLAFDLLVDYLQYHFDAEEKLMEIYQYQEREQHLADHRMSMQKILDLQERVRQALLPTPLTFRNFFEEHILLHIQEDDCKYGALLNTKGVY
ncbi:bacteriohemerythrin [Chrysiogenes arsenatis]|uniref:bacteriohemerythrin n=1 Tax=Chrysiogenes arsenatis TaxID=309797 RepID=UPI0003FF1317|nr:bacteriohemerythrin [Chrysiogenes arsenatis]